VVSDGISDENGAFVHKLTQTKATNLMNSCF